VLFLTVEVVVVVVGATGFSTTVVHDVNRIATAKSGVRMISFFIVGIGILQGHFGADASTRCISEQVF
jgi:hypothetical protein